MRVIYLLDTSVVAEPVQKFPNENVVHNLLHKNSLCQIPSVVWHELLYALNRMADCTEKKVVEYYLMNVILENYDFLSYDEHAAWICADIRTRLEASGKNASVSDLQIASCAIANNMILVTNNVSAFAEIQKVSNLNVENWFE